MPRAFSAADVVQRKSAALAPTATPGVSLDNPAGSGHAGVLFMCAHIAIDPPEQWHAIGASLAGSVFLAVMVRADLPAGEQAWTFTSASGVPGWYWLAEEWANVSFAPLAAAGGWTDSVFAPTSISAGTTGTTDAPFVAVLAAVFLQSSGGSVWPSTAWSNGFTETHTLQVGDGTANGDIQLRVARWYGTGGETGPFETTATFTGSTASKQVFGVIVPLRAENYTGDI